MKSTENIILNLETPEAFPLKSETSLEGTDTAVNIAFGIGTNQWQQSAITVLLKWKKYDSLPS